MTKYLKLSLQKVASYLKTDLQKVARNYRLFIENMIIFLAKEKWIYAKIIRKKIVWLEKLGMKKPLMVVGARQIGKTYTVEKFAKENFEEYLYFNLEKNLDVRNIFEKSIIFWKC